MADIQRPIGVFDSGVGGLGILKEAYTRLSNEDFLYYADMGNAPYGDKSDAQICRLMDSALAWFFPRDIKALVIACNTATAAAVDYLREKYPDLPTISTEPAVKPAFESAPQGKILVMATPSTLKFARYRQLAEKYGGADVIAVPCTGLATLVETDGPASAAVHTYLANKLAPFSGMALRGVVLGCTHYNYLCADIRCVLGDVAIFDGTLGTTLRLVDVLEEKKLLRAEKGPHTLEFFITGEAPVGERGRELLASFWRITPPQESL